MVTLRVPTMYIKRLISKLSALKKMIPENNLKALKSRTSKQYVQCCSCSCCDGVKCSSRVAAQFPLTLQEKSTINYYETFPCGSAGEVRFNEISEGVSRGRQRIVKMGKFIIYESAVKMYSGTNYIWQQRRPIYYIKLYAINVRMNFHTRFFASKKCV